MNAKQLMKQQEAIAEVAAEIAEAAKVTADIQAVKPQPIRSIVRLVALWVAPFVCLWALGVSPEAAARVAIVPMLVCAGLLYAMRVAFRGLLIFQEAKIREIEAKTESIRAAMAWDARP